MMGILIKGEKSETDTHRENAMWTSGQRWVMHLQAKECQLTTKTGGSRKRVFPHSPWKEPTLLTPGPSPSNSGTVFKPPSSWCFIMAALAALATDAAPKWALLPVSSGWTWEMNKSQLETCVIKPVSSVANYRNLDVSFNCSGFQFLWKIPLNAKISTDFFQVFLYSIVHHVLYRNTDLKICIVNGWLYLLQKIVLNIKTRLKTTCLYSWVSWLL